MNEYARSLQFLCSAHNFRELLHRIFWCLGVRRGLECMSTQLLELRIPCQRCSNIPTIPCNLCLVQCVLLLGRWSIEAICIGVDHLNKSLADRVAPGVVLAQSHQV